MGKLTEEQYYYLIGSPNNVTSKNGTVIKACNKSIKDNIGGILLFDFFILSWLPINFICLFIKDCTWDHIKHNRNIDTLNI